MELPDSSMSSVTYEHCDEVKLTEVADLSFPTCKRTVIFALSQESRGTGMGQLRKNPNEAEAGSDPVWREDKFKCWCATENMV